MTLLLITNINEDGHIIQNSGIYTRESARDEAICYYGSSGNYVFRSYFEWDISAIPYNARISKVRFLYDSFFSWGDTITCHNVALQPSAVSDENLYNSIYNGNSYATFKIYYPMGSKSLDLGGTVISDLTAALDRDWFAIGMTNSVNGAQDSICSENFVGVDPLPTLEVTYTIPHGLELFTRTTYRYP